MTSPNVPLSKHISHYRLERRIFWQGNDRRGQNRLVLVSGCCFLSSCFRVLGRGGCSRSCVTLRGSWSFGGRLGRWFLFRIVCCFTRICLLNFDQTFTLSGRNLLLTFLVNTPVEISLFPLIKLKSEILSRQGLFFY